MKLVISSMLMGALMLGAAATTKVVTPTLKMADRQARFSLEQMIPLQFGEWRLDTSVVPLQVDPETQAKLDRLYNQTLARTYINRDGARIMLSVAYGGDQSDNMSVHKPEICYTAQGFQVSAIQNGALELGYGALPVRRLFAVSGNRQEPITYWITVGEKASAPGTEQRLQMLRYGLSGVVPDGMLVRVSNISGEPAAAYALQQQFVSAMLQALEPAARKRLIGSFER